MRYRQLPHERIRAAAGTTGGESTITTGDNPNFSENYVIIDPNNSPVGAVYEVTSSYYSNKVNGTPPDPNYPPFVENNNVTTNTTIKTMHGIGHVINQGKPQNSVIDYENSARSIFKTQNSNGTYTNTPLTPRKYDSTHNSTIK